MTTATHSLSSERLAELVEETRSIARAVPEHEWDRRAIDWPLSHDSVVVEIGGYKGRWALQIAERYHPKLYVFEPQDWAYEVCKGVLGLQATVHNYALGTHNGTHTMGKWGTDGCSFLGWTPGDESQGEIRDAVPILNEIGDIDLMLINIEGYEYLLIPYLLDNLIALPHRLMIQFHTFVESDRPDLQMIALRKQLLQWYAIEWDYGPTLSAWQRKAL